VIIGPNGAGKTTLLDLICGKTKASGGSIKFKNEELTGLEEHIRVRRGIGRKFQTPSIYENLSVFQNLEVSYPSGRSVFGALGFKCTDEVKARVQVVAEEIGLAHALDMEAGLLSHGQKQWLEIGMLLMQDPELLMLDEPIAGMSARRARAHRRAAQAHLQEPFGDRDRARHGVRQADRAQGHCHAPGKDPGRRLHGHGAGRSQGDRRLPRPLTHKESNMLKVTDMYTAYGQSEALHGISFEGRKTRPSPSWAATAWARPRCSKA